MVLYLSSDFKVFWSVYPFFGDCSKWTNYKGITITFVFHCFFTSLERSRYLSLILNIIYGSLKRHNPQDDKLFFMLICHYYYLTDLIVFHTSTPLEFKCQQESSRFLNSSQHYGWSRQCYILDGFYLSCGVLVV